MFWQLMCVGQIYLGGPILQKTRLGWIVSGKVINKKQSDTVACNYSEKQFDLQKFWEFENIEQTVTSDIDEFFDKNTERDANGRFIVILPVKNYEIKLGESRD